jgi:gamma-glutamylcyclotransferase (GGCT)/AIG2-like uncharacterized protein YtfP
MPSRLFAYGTLMPTDADAVPRQGWAADAVRGRLFDLGPHPGLIDLDVPGTGWVEGYVRAVEPVELEAFDRWEDVDLGTYRRVETATRNGLRAWVYVYARQLPPTARGPLSRWSNPEPAQGSICQSFGLGERDDR